MRSFCEYHPIAVAVYFLAASGIAMLCMNPILLSLSLLGAVLLFVLQSIGERPSHFGYLALFLLMALINPLVSHNGVTVLFVINDSPITAEAVLYGLVAAGMITAVLYWFRSFGRIMTSDKLLYLFGKLSPRLSLVLSMGLRYVPLFQQQVVKVNSTQRAMGLYKEDNIVDRFRGGLRVFSVMITWALENGIVTADSMAARGYGIGRRTHFSKFRFTTSDWLLLLASLGLGGAVCVCIALGEMEFVCYPSVYLAPLSPLAVIGYFAYGTLALMPSVIEIWGRVKWKYLRSKI